MNNKEIDYLLEGEKTNNIRLNNKLNSKVKNSCLALILSLAVISCSTQSNPTTQNISVNNISDQQNITTIKVSDKYSNASIKINISSSPLLAKRGAGGEFSTKANTDGTAPKTAANVDKYLVYLVKNNSTTGYPLNGDPLGTDKVAGPFTITNSGAATKTVNFTNIQPLPNGAYYVAVRAQDSTTPTPADIIKTNNGSATLWTGTATAGAPVNGKVAVSSGPGITVDPSYVVTPKTPLAVSVKLLDGIGATISAQTTINEVNTTPSKNKDLGYVINTVAGGGSSLGDGGQATSAKLNNPYAVTLDSAGNMYIADWAASRVRKVIASTGIINTIAGDGTLGDTGNGGQGTLAKIARPTGIALDSTGNVYFSQLDNNFIKKIDTSGIITTFENTSGRPYGIYIDSSDNLYYCQQFDNNVIKKNLSTGVITTFAGTGTAGAGGDGGQATLAQLNGPYGVTGDLLGNIYIADAGNRKVRKIDKTGIISTIAGIGTGTFGGDGGQATSAKLNYPLGLALDPSGSLYISDIGNDRIRKLE